jgi:hypothetical protein
MRKYRLLSTHGKQMNAESAIESIVNKLMQMHRFNIGHIQEIICQRDGQENLKIRYTLIC